MENRRNRRSQFRSTHPRSAFDSARRHRWRHTTDLANFGRPSDLQSDRDIGIYGSDRTTSGLALRQRQVDPYQRRLWDWYFRIQPGTVSNWLPVPKLWPVPW